MTLLNVCLGSKHLISDEGFRKALYMIDIGQNDLSDSFTKDLSYVQVTERIPSVIEEIKSAVEVSSASIQTIIKRGRQSNYDRYP